MILTGLSGSKYEISSKPFSSGGEGDIYSVVGTQDKVAKIYHQNRITSELEQKLIIMAKKPPSNKILSQVAWPLDILYSNSSFCGFVMPRLNITNELGEIYKYPPKKPISYKAKLIIAQNICAVISEVHRAGFVFGDFNPKNIGIDIKTCRVAFLDTDSYHIIDGNTIYRCKVCLDGYVAPELLSNCEISKKDYANAPLPTFTKETDNFALAIHIFRLLMNGYTPFNGIKETESVSTANPGVGNQAIKRNNYCFKPGNKPQAVAVPSIDVLPAEIQDLFTRAFIYGRIDPKKRPSAIEWHRALVNYENDLMVCAKNQTHSYRKGLNTCPWCGADDRFASAIAAPSSLTQKSFSGVMPTAPIQRTTTVISNSSVNSYVTGATHNAASYASPVKAGGYSSTKTGKKKKIIAAICAIVCVLLVRGCIRSNQAENKTTQYSSSGSGATSNNSNLKYNKISIDEVEWLSYSAESVSPKTETVGTAEILKWYGTFTTEKQDDYYTFVAERDGTYSVYFSDILEGQEYAIQLINAAGNAMNNSYLSSTYGLNEPVSFSLTGGQSYTIRVRQYSSYYGEYCLNLGVQKPIVDVSDCTYVEDSMDFWEQQNSYYYTPKASGSYRIGLSGMPEGYKYKIQVLNPGGNVIEDYYWNHTYENNEGVTVSLTARQTYTIKTRQYSNYLGNYCLNIGMPKQNLDISTYHEISDSIDYAGEYCVYSFTPEHTATYEFGISDAPDGNEYSILVSNPGGDVIGGRYSYFSNKESLTVNLTAGQTYTITVESRNSNCGSFKFNISCYKNEVDISEYNMISDSFQYYLQKNIYTYTANTSSTYKFELSGMPSGYSCYIQIADEGNNVLAGERCCSNNESLKANLEAGKTYTLILRQNSDYISDYDLLISVA